MKDIQQIFTEQQSIKKEMKIREDARSITTFHWFNTLKRTPDNWITVTPVRVFGVFIGRLLKVKK